MKLSFVTLDVFTTSKFKGNQLAIVHLDHQITHAHKQSIAREFNYSETVFLHKDNSIDIFTTTEELPFAGHPTVGSGWYLLHHIHPSDPSITLKTKAGPIPVSRAPLLGRVRLQTPVHFKIHASFAGLDPLGLLPLVDADIHRGAHAPVPVVSIVKGMTFLLLRLSSLEALAKLKPLPSRVRLPDGYLGDFAGFVGLYSYVILDESQSITRIRTRMFDGSLEDPAGGSAASALSGYLAQGSGSRSFEIVQGVEMGRPSEIFTHVRLTDAGEVDSIELEGSAVVVMQGSLSISDDTSA